MDIIFRLTISGIILMAMQLTNDLAFALDTPIRNSPFVCRSAGASPKLLVERSGVVKIIPFNSALSSLKRKVQQLKNKITVQRASIPALSRIKKKRAKAKILAFKKQIRLLKKVRMDVLTCRTAISSEILYQPSDFIYQGAFRLPGGDTAPKTFAYGGNAMTHAADRSGPSGGLPGTLFITGHDRQPYGALPNGGQVAEISIPNPVIASSVEALPQASFVQPFYEVTAGFFGDFDEIPRIGMQYLNHPLTGALIHIGWGQHFHVAVHPTNAWFKPNLSDPQTKGSWFIGELDPYSLNSYTFNVAETWSASHVDGQPLATGRYRDGGWGSMGPTLIAYKPWHSDGSAPSTETQLSSTTLLLYESSLNTDRIVRCLAGYQHADEWEGGAWLENRSGKSAVLFAGNKGIGDKYWYGYRHADGSGRPCVDPDSVGEFRVCLQKDGTDCPASDLGPCPHEDNRGWWASQWQAQLILYKPADLAKVAAASIKPWEPQPYATINIEPFLFLNPAGIEELTVGSDKQRRYKIGDVAYDRLNSYLYLLEYLADQSKPVVHVWRLRQ